MTQPPSDQEQFGQRPYVHFLHDPMSMCLDRPFGRAQFKRNLFVDLASNQQVENLPLTRGQPSNASAKARGVYRGRKASIDPVKVKALKAEGMGPSAIAKALKIGRASVYRALET
jgi:hypothetical protein